VIRPGGQAKEGRDGAKRPTTTTTARERRIPIRTLMLTLRSLIDRKTQKDKS